ncbi:DnaJ domain containing protein [Acanthamoeba castellanii str. Neff]|uniref:DnaJ domain containing protein n=1 Tax=Acanthamoeba castellanii (strain ATCC 30010 / Neff) TaxID=1257118 RepID=L8GLL5_ACACF|nr:DnaJ domain containing protein [Acanthamoeba castellanii str. Neff]ELR13583.1 DnaJ domain containing protein [Acanthamoeba castellanii str. Neff]
MDVLRELFPGHDPDVLTDVLHGLQGDLTAAIDALLHTTNPNPSPTAPSSPPLHRVPPAEATTSVVDHPPGAPHATDDSPPPSAPPPLLRSGPPQAVPTLCERCLAQVAESVVLPLVKPRNDDVAAAAAAVRGALAAMPRGLVGRVWAALFEAVVAEAAAGASSLLFAVAPHTTFAQALAWFFPLCASDPTLVAEVAESISRYPYRDKFNDATMELMFEPLKQCPLLTQLSIVGCSSLIYPQLCSPYLVKLSLCDCARLNDLAVQWLLERSPQLQELDLAGCHRLTSPRIESGSLVWVNMESCRGLMFPEVRNSPHLLHVLVPEGCKLDWRRPKPPPSAGGDDLLSIERILGCAGDYYAVLGLTPDAALAQITKQYRTMALKLHPDKNAHPASEEAFKVMAEAFACLSDAGQRAQYDAHGAAEIRPEVLRRAERVLAEVQAYVYAHVLQTLFGALPRS